MARTFTLNFPFREKTCKILVSIKETNNVLACWVRYLDSEIRQLIPNGNLKFQLSGSFYCSANVETDHAAELIFCTSNAIAEHLISYP
jgi:hypothetical protein